MSVYDQIRLERMAQDEKWGGPDHDDQHDITGFARFIEERTQRIQRWEPHKGKDVRRQMVEVAALAVAALEAWDREFSA